MGPMKRQGAIRLLVTVALPLALAVPLYPSVSIWWFHVKEPAFINPLGPSRGIHIRQDPYGKGHFGAKRSGGRIHRGVDLVAPVGSQVRAAKSGLARIGRIRNGMGRYLEIHHPDGWVTRYGHLRTILVRDRQRVKRGQVVGLVGKTGNAGRRLIRSHLHFEVMNPEGEPVDPLSVMEEWLILRQSA